MGYECWDAFYAELNVHRAKISGHFAYVISDNEEESEERAEISEWQSTLGTWFEQAKCGSLGAAWGKGCWEIAISLGTLEQSRTVMMMQKAGRERLDSFIPACSRQ